MRVRRSLGGARGDAPELTARLRGVSRLNTGDDDQKQVCASSAVRSRAFGDQPSARKILRAPQQKISTMARLIRRTQDVLKVRIRPTMADLDETIRKQCDPQMRFAGSQILRL